MRNALFALTSALALTVAPGADPAFAGSSVDGRCPSILAEHDTSSGNWWYCHHKWNHGTFGPYAHVLNYGYPPLLPYVYAPVEPAYAYPLPAPAYPYPPPALNYDYGYPPPVQPYEYAPY